MVERVFCGLRSAERVKLFQHSFISVFMWFARVYGKVILRKQILRKPTDTQNVIKYMLKGLSHFQTVLFLFSCGSCVCMGRPWEGKRTYIESQTIHKTE